MHTMNAAQTASELDKMRGYIKRTPPSELDSRYQMRFSQVIELSRMARGGATTDAISLAFEYGRAMGLRMGRKEAAV